MRVDAESFDYVSCRSGGNAYRSTDIAVDVFGTTRQVVTHAVSGASYYLVPCDPHVAQAITDHLAYDMRFYPPYYRSDAEWWHRGDVRDASLFGDGRDGRDKQDRRSGGGDGDRLDAWMDDHYWDYLIERPANPTLFLWPMDVADASGDDFRQLVFPMRDLHGYVPLSHVLSNINDRPRPEFAWHAAVNDAALAPLSKGLIAVFAELEQIGYLNGGFDIGRMYYQADDPSHVVCDFSQTMIRVDGLPPLGGAGQRTAVTLPNLVTGEYVDPYAWSRMDNGSGPLHIDRLSERFTLAAMLFRLLVGRMPFDGRAVEPQWSMNTDAQMHDVWVRAYQSSPVFIFDPRDTSNTVGGEDAPESERHFVDNWNKLTPQVRGMFLSVFRNEKATRLSDSIDYPTPEQWRDVLRI